MTERELEIVGHSLGINVYHARKTKVKKDKKLPTKFYRNHFVAEEGHADWETLLSLEQKDLMFRGKAFNQTCFAVTEKGIEEFRTRFEKEIVL